MNYSQAEAYLQSFTDYEQVSGTAYAPTGYSLEHVEQLLRRIGSPHRGGKTIHIAGTKGKGSIAAMIARVLMVSGYKTGLYTSPHLHVLRERIKVDDRMISLSEFSALVTDLKPYFDAVESSSPCQRLSFFEALTVLAFAYFRQREVEFQVLEVGLGGRLDATNVVAPQVCVIAPISMDHMQVLGDSVDKIAYEKAGIIKSGSMVVSSPQVASVASVIREVSRARGARLIQVGRDVIWHEVNTTLSYQSFVVECALGSIPVTIPLLGDFQVENATVAVAALAALSVQGYNISREDIIQGLSCVQWPGRFQILHRHPFLVVDGAHNVESMRRLVENLKASFCYDHIYLILGVSQDKDIAGIVQELLVLSPRVIVTQSHHPRAASPSVLSAEFSHHAIDTRIIPAVCDALEQVSHEASPEDVICITGSLFVVAEALDHVCRVNPFTS